MTSSKKYGYTQALHGDETAESVKYTLNMMIDALQSNADKDGYVLDWPNVLIETEQEEFYHLSALRQQPTEITILRIALRGVKP